MIQQLHTVLIFYYIHMTFIHKFFLFLFFTFGMNFIFWIVFSYRIMCMCFICLWFIFFSEMKGRLQDFTNQKGSISFLFFFDKIGVDTLFKNCVSFQTYTRWSNECSMLSKQVSFLLQLIDHGNIHKIRLKYPVLNLQV